MGRLLKRIILGIACLLIFTGWGMTIDSIADQRGTYQGFEYRYNEEYQGIEIIAYKGSDSKVVIPNVIDGVSVNSIGNYAFYNNTNLQDVVIPEGIEYLGASCFEGSGLKQVVLPHNIKLMKESVFSNCVNLEEVSLSTGYTSIPKMAFANCCKLKRINNIANIRQIDEAAFEMCDGFERLDLTKCKNLRVIKRGAFRACTSLKEIKLPSSLEMIEGNSFLECCYLKKVVFQKGSCLNKIGYGAFQTCIRLKTITLPKKIKSIEKLAFYNCRKLEIIKFQSKVPKMANSAFTKINADAIIYVPNKYKSQYTSVLKKNKWLKSKMKIKTL